MKIIVTGSSGFIGSALTVRLLEQGHDVLGIDNHNSYYDVSLKEARLQRNSAFKNFSHSSIDISNVAELMSAFEAFKPDYVVNLAAQAGVRYSMLNPSAYIQSNIVGFGNILEACKIFQIKHLVYASSSSVYGAGTAPKFSESLDASHPLSLYAATKKSNELMAHAYSNLYSLPTTGLRFFTAYGPWGRPDMALFKFTKAILSGDEIEVFNSGMHQRDFTYIDDVVDGLSLAINRIADGDEAWCGLNPDPATSRSPWRIYNIGKNTPINLLSFIQIIEAALDKKAKIKYLPLQDGDVPNTLSNIDLASNDLGYVPRIGIDEGVKNFINWYLTYYK